jgi:hypothetical protein
VAAARAHRAACPSSILSFVSAGRSSTIYDGRDRAVVWRALARLDSGSRSPTSSRDRSAPRALLDLFLSILRLPPRRLSRSFAGPEARALRQSHLEGSHPWIHHQALVAADAIVRTLVRRFVRAPSVGWESMAQADSTPRVAYPGVLFLTPVAACALLVSLKLTGHAAGIVRSSSPASGSPHRGSPGGWTGSPLETRCGRAAIWIPSRRRPAPGFFLVEPTDAVDRSRQRRRCVGTGRLSASPTNAGLQLGATLAARFQLPHPPGADAGFARARHTRVARSTVGTSGGRNAPSNLTPRYVSSVDSGNLCASFDSGQGAWTF